MADYVRLKTRWHGKLYRGKVGLRTLRRSHRKAQDCVDYAKRVEARLAHLRALAQADKEPANG